MLLMISILMRKILIRLKKLTVDDVKDEQDFKLEDEVTDDSTEHVRKVDNMPNMKTI